MLLYIRILRLNIKKKVILITIYFKGEKIIINKSEQCKKKQLYDNFNIL